MRLESNFTLLLLQRINGVINEDDELKFRDKPIVRIALSNLQESKIDGSLYSFNNQEIIKFKEEKTPPLYQVPAIEALSIEDNQYL